MLTASYSVVFCLFVSVVALYEGDTCKMKTTNEKGKCVLLNNCEYAKELLKTRQRPQHCGFRGRTPIVCCPASPKITSGQKSQKQCDIYNPRNDFGILVFGGKKSLAKEFPHMAILGYGDQNNIQWLCGGSLISEMFILTAAHCVDSQELGIVKWVRLGDLDIKNTTDDAKPQDFTVAQIFSHPEYKSSSHYHDVALLQLDRAAQFNEYVKPACLFTNRTITEQLTATGWGQVDFFGESSSHLMKVDLNYIGYEDCAKAYLNAANRKLMNGIIDDMQICAGHPAGQDTCPGDSGGPLQFKANTKPPRFYIVGLTSFGKACGIENSVGVYIRVARYAGWIEDIVWPSE